MSATEVEVIEHQTPREPAALPVLSEQTVLLQVIARAAADSAIDLDRMERLFVMHERLNAKRAEREFIEAMARFKQDAPKIIKDKLVSFPHKSDDGQTSYKHATLGAVCAAAIAGLAKVGISHRWDLKQADGRVEVTCVLTHTGGHSTSTMLSGAPDASGKKNTLQQVSSTISYLERYTLLAATGLATEDDDDGAGGAEPTEPHVNAPEGYLSWKTDMNAVLGEEHLAKAWQGSKAEYRAYVVLADQDWWNARKRAVAGK
jgi:ERF superfamily